jgi:cytosine/uracil/thiamine/allantoin permease
VRAVIDIVMAPVFAAAGAFFLCPWHFFSKLP